VLIGGNQCLTAGKLKKQSQFTLNLMGATPFVKGDSGKFPLCGIQKNKAKQSQFLKPSKESTAVA
jgi:hypothetical protein